MGINLVIAVTDGDWHEMLRRQPDLGEVNFWAPSATKFRALEPGELFLFKLHAPRDFIVGGGTFFAPARCPARWRGRHSERQMGRTRYRRCARALDAIGGQT
jgi:hypothetical protein